MQSGLLELLQEGVQVRRNMIGDGNLKEALACRWGELKKGKWKT
jgi:hypothetical protein